MPSVFTHAAVAVALKAAFPAPQVPNRLLLLGVAGAVAPDLDVLSFNFGIPYEAMLGHRGLSHSLLFALVFSVGAVFAAFPRREPLVDRRWAWLYLFLAIVSHGLLDALTNGGMGVAFFAPFNNTRYFFPWSPIMVSPIGAAFISRAGLQVLENEFVWVWLPAMAFAVVALIMWHFIRRAPQSDEAAS